MSTPFKVDSSPLPQYELQHMNGAKAIIRTYGGNCFSYITKEGIQVMGTRADADIKFTDTKPYAGGNPHCFPQFGPGALMQHGFARGMRFVPGERMKSDVSDRMTFQLVPTEDTRKVINRSPIIYLINSSFIYRSGIMTLNIDVM